MVDVGFVFFLVLYIIWWPISHLFHAILVLLSPLWTLITFLLLPFIHLAHTLVTIITFPFSAQWLDRIETLYIYLGIAGLIGCITGSLIFILFKFLSSTLNIESGSAIMPRPRDQGRTTAQFRASQRTKQEVVIQQQQKQELPPSPVVLDKVPGPRRKGLLSQAIIEEEDSDF
ncbi:hypothetical protein GQ44DRAFT_739171 [Phaeosphaeriaceae sp. PMI808]|nr:hypothetical protein GQ44DRAFT_739171 [Phaeosphaeriaceae sp. PMI808]